MSRPRLIPGPDHPISVEANGTHVVVRAGETVLADTRNALTLREASYPPAYYVPLADVEQSLLVDSDTNTYCPYKGEASYYGVTTASVEIADAMWFYREPYDAVIEIADHVAFYTDRVDVSVDE